MIAFVVGLITCSSFHLVAVAQEAAVAVDEETERAKELYEEYASTAKLLEVSPVKNNMTFKLQQEPLMKFATEGTVFGSVYVWHDAAQRLAMIGTIGSLPIENVDMEFVELHLLKPVAIKPVSFPGFPPRTWNPGVEGLSPKPIPGAPNVAPVAATRLVQMRSLARQFSAEMTHKGRANQLRLLPQPLYRYADSTSDRDGALFAFVWDTGTDPELLIRVEALGNEGQVQWHYQPIRFTWRGLELKHKDADVWKMEEFVERDAANQTTPYITGMTRPLAK